MDEKTCPNPYNCHWCFFIVFGLIAHHVSTVTHRSCRADDFAQAVCGCKVWPCMGRIQKSHCFVPIVKSSNETILEQKTGWVLDVNSTLADGSTNMNVLLIVGHAFLQKQNRHNAMFCVASVTKSPAIQPIDLFVACGRLIFPSVAGGSFGEDAM